MEMKSPFVSTYIIEDHLPKMNICIYVSVYRVRQLTQAYMYNDDDFNWNHGISLSSTFNFKAAEEALLLVVSEKLKQEYCYISWLTRQVFQIVRQYTWTRVQQDSKLHAYTLL